ncbi:MAG TPA: hypothetical protein VN418_06025, partial [Gammaproteobacteria bacterium]|nr:hypothetical protein [Gammaproteobacteria bacterium]
MQALFKRAALLYLPAVAVFSVVVWLSVSFDEQRRLDRSETRESSRVQIARGMILQDFSVAASELHIMANLPVLKMYLDSG